MHEESVMKTVSSFSTKKLSGVQIKRHQVESTRNLDVRVNGDAATPRFGQKKGQKQFKGMKWKTLMQVGSEP